MTQSRVPGELTRRTLLGAAAAAGAASLVGPAEGLGAALGAHPRIFSRWVGSLRGRSAVLTARRRFALVGIEWSAPAGARIELRTRAPDGGWSRWAVASVLGHGPDRVRGGDIAADGGLGAGVFGEPIWSGVADRVQLQSAERVEGVRLHFVAAPVPAAPVSTALRRATPVLEAGPGQPPIIARRAWARGNAPPRFAPAYGSVKLAFIHHTETPNGYGPAEVPAMLRSIFDFHRFVRGWNDFGYNFAVDRFGQIWEGRAGGIDEPVAGAQAGGYNFVSTGVAVLGTFIDVVPSAAAIDALEHLLAWKLSLHGVPAIGQVSVQVDPAGASYTPFAPGASVSLPRIAGHRDGDATACPGSAFYARLPSIRPRVAALAGTPAKLTLLAQPEIAIAGASVTVSGQLMTLGGPALAGAPIDLQVVSARGATTVGTAVTASDGSWSAVLAPTSSVLVRALHRPLPATVSEVAPIGVAPLVTLGVDSISPLRVSGTVSAAKRMATIDVYALGQGHRRRVDSKRLTVRRGRFAGRIHTRRRGRLVLIARTAADARNVAGSSPPVDVTL